MKRRHIVRGAPAAVVSVVSSIVSVTSIPGCVSVTERPTLYANWKGRNITVDMKTPFSLVRIPNGEEITVSKLSDGEDAIVLMCTADPRQPLRSPDVPSLTMARKSAEIVVRERCVQQGVRICRVKTRGGNSTFAVMDEIVIAADTVPNTALFVRCLTPEDFKQWVLTVDPTGVDRHAIGQWQELRE